MASTDQGLVNALWAAQQEAADERDTDLIDAFIEDVRPLRESHPEHVSEVYEVVLETGLLCFFKPANGFQSASIPLKRALQNYGQTPVSSVIHECAAWQLARWLGGVWQDISMPAVARMLELPNGVREFGSLARFRPGRTGSLAYFRGVPKQAAAGAFFDCLIGQQDRNRGNVLWHEERERIYLIDNAFSFMRADDARGIQELQQWRWETADRSLTSAEQDAIGALVDSDLFGLRKYLEADRAEALLARALQMREAGEVLPWKGKLAHENDA
jgi:hypothetical protein